MGKALKELCSQQKKCSSVIKTIDKNKILFDPECLEQGLLFKHNTSKDSEEETGSSIESNKKKFSGHNQRNFYLFRF